MASSGECHARQIQVSHFLCSFLLCIWVSASTDHSAATSTALIFTVKPRICCESARNSFWPFTVAVSHVMELLPCTCGSAVVFPCAATSFELMYICSRAHAMALAVVILDTIFFRLSFDSDGYLLIDVACDDLLCLLPLIALCDRFCVGFTSSALHLSVRALGLAHDSWQLSPLRHRASKLLLESVPQLLRDLLIGLCAFLLGIIHLLGDPTCFGLCGPNDVEVLVHGECTVLLHRTRLLLELHRALSLCTQRSCFACWTLTWRCCRARSHDVTSGDVLTYASSCDMSCLVAPAQSCVRP